MRKFILVIAFASAVGLIKAQKIEGMTPDVTLITVADSQGIVSKKGAHILPEAKDWSIGFDAKPVFNYFGNMFNHSTNDSLYAGFQNPLIITGKYFKDASTAYRGMFRIGYTLLTDNAFLDDENSQVTPHARVTDTRTTLESNIAFGFGMQHYRGRGRLKGYYGWEGDLSLATRKQTFAYGNALTATNADPSANSTNFGAILNDTLTNIQGESRLTEQKLGTTFGIGVRGYLGIEYFFAAKFSIGAEYGWGMSLLIQGQGEQISESFDGTNLDVLTTTTKTGSHTIFGFDTDNMGGAIFLSAYF